MPNTNCLADISCPNCNSTGPFDITVLTTARISDEGLQVLRGELSWDKTSGIACPKCGTFGYVSAFTEPHLITWTMLENMQRKINITPAEHDANKQRFLEQFITDEMVENIARFNIDSKKYNTIQKFYESEDFNKQDREITRFIQSEYFKPNAVLARIAKFDYSKDMRAQQELVIAASRLADKTSTD